MIQLPIKKTTNYHFAQRLWRRRQREWKKAGCIGKKPKFHQTCDDLVEKAKEHPEIVKELGEQDNPLS